MTINKKLILILFLSIILPIIFPILSNCFYRDKYFYGYNCSSVSFMSFSIIPLLGGILISVLNYKSGYKSKFWYSVSFIIVALYILYLFSIYSLSNFGF